MEYLKYESSSIDWCEENFLVVNKKHIIYDILQKFKRWAPPGTTKEQIMHLVNKLEEKE